MSRSEPTGSPSRWGLPAVLVAAATIRLWLLATPVLELDADEAVTGVMARRILDGHHRAFFAGQDYMGSPEQYLQAATLAVAPDTELVLRLPQVALAVLATALVHRLALRCRLSPRRALLAAALFAVGPYFPVFWSVKSRGAYGVAMVLGLAGLVLALGIQHDDRRRIAKAAAFGLVAGGAFWANQQSAYLLLPAAWWLAGTVRGRWVSTVVAALPGFVVGAAPALWHAATTDAALFGGTQGDSAIAERATHFLTGTLPDLLGVRDDAEPLAPWLPPAFASLVALLVLGMVLDRRRRGLLALAALRRDERQPLDVLLGVLLVAPVLYVLSGTATTATSRFVFVLHGVLPVLIAAVPVPAWLRERTRPIELGGLAVLLVGLHTWMGAQLLITQDDGAHDAGSDQEVRLEDMGPVGDALRQAGAETAYADYWLAHPLTWDADGAVLVESLFTRRFPHISEAVEADASPALVVSAGEIADVRTALDERGAGYTVAEAAGWWVVTGITPGLHLPHAATVADAVRAAP